MQSCTAKYSLGPLSISEILSIRHTLGQILRIRLHALKTFDIGKCRLDKHVVVGQVGELRIDELVHLFAGFGRVVDLCRQSVFGSWNGFPGGGS